MKVGDVTERAWGVVENQKVINTAWLLGTIAVIYIFGHAWEESRVPHFDPHRKAEIVDRYQPRPGSFTMVLEQCGFPAALTTAEDGCLDKSINVSRQDYTTDWPEDSVRADQLHEPKP